MHKYTHVSHFIPSPLQVLLTLIVLGEGGGKLSFAKQKLVNSAFVLDAQSSPQVIITLHFTFLSTNNDIITPNDIIFFLTQIECGH